MRVLTTLLSLFMFAGCQQAPTGPQPLTDADKDQITEFMEDHVKAVLANDASAYTALYSEDGIQLPPNEEMRRGKAEIQERVESLFKERKVTAFTNPLVEVYGVGDLAYRVGTYTIKFEPVGGIGPVTVDGKYVAIFKRQADDSWKWAVTIWNSNQPSPQQGKSPSGN